MTTDEAVVSVNIFDFFEEADEQGGGGSFGVVCRARLDTGYYAMISGNSKFFPALDMNKKGEVRNAASTYLESVGGKLSRGNPAFAFQFTQFKDGFLNAKAPNWEGDSFTSVFHSRRLPTGQDDESGRMIFDVTPDYSVFSSGLRDLGEQANEFVGREVYVHYIRVPDPTFDKDDESTHTQYNHWMNAEGEPVPNLIPKIVAFFHTQEEALAYLEEHGQDVSGENEESGGVDSVFEMVNGEVEMPDGFAEGEMWEPSDYPALLKGLVTSFVSGKDLKSVVSDYKDTPFNKQFILSVKNLVEA